MLNRLAILALFLVITQAPVPTSGQASNHPANTSGSIKTNGKNNKRPPAQPPSISQPAQATKEQYDAYTEAGEDKPQPIAIREFPPVSVTKDWVDKSYWVFSGLLVLVGGLQVWLLWRTLGAIKRQADTMDAQARDSKASGAKTLAAIKEQNDNLLISAKAATVMAMASNRSAKAAFSQIEMMKDKERARVEMKPLGLEVTRVGDEFWHIKTAIELRNVGAGRAYVRLGTGNLVMMGDEMPVDPYLKSLDVVDGFVDPTSPVTESFYFFQPDDDALSDFSQRIWNGGLQPRITGFIEYETVGTRFHRNFSYVWIGNGSPSNIGAMFRAADDFAPETDEDKVSFGYWLPNSIWLTGWSGDNEEYEVAPQKKRKKPRQQADRDTTMRQAGLTPPKQDS